MSTPVRPVLLASMVALALAGCERSAPPAASAPEAAAPRLYRADSDQDRPNQAPVALRRQG